ncbi:MAG: holo-ACP synthase [Chlamydiales bacterium]
MNIDPTATNIIGLGNDVIEVKRIEQAINKYKNKFLHRLFTNKEIEKSYTFKDPTLYFAGRFAAKEAIAKALGVGFGKSLSWLDIEILNSPSGQPIVELSKASARHFKSPNILISISHTKLVATAVAIRIQ